jgi:transposase
MQHPNARLTPRGRHELVQLVERGASLRCAAVSCNVALSTAHRWVGRWRAAYPLQLGEPLTGWIEASDLAA